MPHIVVIATGGTIASQSSSVGKVARTKAATLVGAVGQDRLPDNVTVSARDAGTMNSYNLTFDDTRRIAQAIREALDDGADGVVVTHGTDTMEETAFLYDLTSQDPRPVVFTGAQHSADARDGNDGPGNIADAITVAAHPASRGRGALVVFAETILAVRGVTKVDTFAPQPYAAVIGGALGLVHTGLVFYASAPEPWQRLDFPSQEYARLRVATVVNQPNSPATDSGITVAIGQGAAGVVVLGVGAGNTSWDQVAGIEAATAAGIPVVLSTRVPFGHITPTYGNGGAVNAVAAGAIPVWSVPFTQARLLLAVLIDAVGPHQARQHLETFDQRAGRWQPRSV